MNLLTCITKVLHLTHQNRNTNPDSYEQEHTTHTRTVDS